MSEATPGRFWIFEIDLPRTITILCKIDGKKTNDKLRLNIEAENTKALEIARKFLAEDVQIVDTDERSWGVSAFVTRCKEFVDSPLKSSAAITIGSYPTIRFFKDPVDYDAGIQPAATNQYNSRYYTEEDFYDGCY